MSELERLLAQYGEGYAPAAGDDSASAPDVREPGKGDYLRQKFDSYIKYLGDKMSAEANRPALGETQWRGPYDMVPFPAKDSDAADLARTAMLGLLGTQGGKGGSTGGLGWTYHNDLPTAIHVPGGLGILGDIPLLRLAEQPPEILGGVVAPALALTKKDATSLPDSDDLREQAHRAYYSPRKQAERVIYDIAEKPGYHAWNSLRQIPMGMGYTGAAEGAAALGLLKYLPTVLRAREAPMPGTVLERQGARSAP